VNEVLPDTLAVKERKRHIRLGVLAVAGAIGVSSRWVHWPRWLLIALPVIAAGVWIWSTFERVKAGETEAQRRMRMRNIAIALALAGLVALFYLGTMIRLGPNVFNRPI
jgi:fatty acid desaturase